MANLNSAPIILTNKSSRSAGTESSGRKKGGQHSQNSNRATRLWRPFCERRVVGGICGLDLLLHFWGLDGIIGVTRFSSLSGFACKLIVPGGLPYNNWGTMGGLGLNENQEGSGFETRRLTYYSTGE